MSAAEALKVAREAGIRITINGDDLALKADCAPSPALLDQLSRYKLGVIALVRAGPDGWSDKDWIVYFDERASIIEFDGGLPRREAEATAFNCCVAEWLARNPARSSPGCCVGCGDAEHSHDPLLPFGTESSGHAWLHSRCWPAWYADRKAEAVAALANLGITTSRKDQ